MIISHKYKFIFIKTAKTAGTSLEVYLSGVCSKKDIFTPIYPLEDGHNARNYKGFFNPFKNAKSRADITSNLLDFLHRRKFYNHIPASILKQRVSKKVWDSYYKFCVERNPFDRNLSYYHMLKYRGRIGSVEEFFEKSKFLSNFDKYTIQGEICVDEIIRFENMNEEIECLFNKLGVPWEGQLNVFAKSQYRVCETPYRDFFTDKQMDRLQDYFSEEIKTFGYER